MKTLLLMVLLISSLQACHSTRTLPELSSNAERAILPQNNGYVVYLQADTLTGVTMPEINRAAQAWINQHSKEHAFEWQPPVYKAELLYAGQIRPELLQASSSEYYAKREVHYLLTVSGNGGVCRLMLTNFDVNGAGRGPVALEKLVGDQVLCKSVDRVAMALLGQMSTYIRQNVNKPL